MLSTYIYADDPYADTTLYPYNAQIGMRQSAMHSFDIDNNDKDNSVSLYCA